jgi:Ran GTPase-activating protein (RanGAP) involved in mRNA processing and transport
MSDCKLTSKDIPSLLRLLQSSATLMELNLSGCQMNASEAKSIIVAIVSNFYLQNFKLHLANNQFSASFATEFASITQDIANVHHLNLSNNDFTDEGKCECSKSLSLSLYLSLSLSLFLSFSLSLFLSFSTFSVPD